jgi:Zn finger protein HypA/HybF involved in hydrogenase expression
MIAKCLNCNRDYDQETQGYICPHESGERRVDKLPPWPKVKEPETVPDLYELAFMPGQFRCPQCAFQLSKQTLSVVRGCIGTTPENRQSEPCPNDGTMMVHVTYREQLESYADRLKEEFDRFETHTKAVEGFLQEMYATMIDPCEQPKATVAEMCELLLKTAREQREASHNLER